MDTIGIIFLGLALSLMAVVVAIEVRFFIHRLQSARWPTATATIRAEFIGPIGRGARAAFFTYGFTVAKVTYTGRFGLVALASEDPGRKLLRELTGLPISIRQNSKRPGISFLENLYDMRFDGAAGTQNPYWFMNRSELLGETRLFPK
jgi:hypothetical protein